MRFTSIQTAQFRNLANSTIPVGRRQVLLVGENGQGKTNFLEALYVLCYGSSFRTQDFHDLVRIGETSFKLRGVFTDEQNLSHEISLLFKQGKRTIQIDGKTLTDRKQLIYTIPCIVFSHADITFVNGDPEDRRRFFDQTMSMYDSMFLDNLRRYKMLVKQRNQAIKDEKYDLISLYDLQLAKYGLAIQRARNQAVDEFNKIFPSLYKQVSGSDWNVTISYAPSWKECESEDQVIQYLESGLERDKVMQTTTSGVHRDRFLVKVDGKLLVDVGSTGQIRLASLLFRVAQMRFFQQKTGRKPLILLDDVLLELDYEKRARFLTVIDAYDQAFYTFLPEEQYFDTLQGHDAMVYHVKEGELKLHEEA